MSVDETAAISPSGLGAIASEDGTFAIVAMDQRNTLRRMFAAVNRPAEDEDVRTFKADVAVALTDGATGLLLDPDLGVPAVLESGALHGRCGMLVAAEPPQRQQWNGEPRASRDAFRDAAWVVGMGGHALKFFVQMRPDRPRAVGGPDLVAEVLEVVRQVVEDCQAAGVPSVASGSRRCSRCPGLCCRRVWRSSASRTCCGLPASTAAHQVSSPAVPSGRRR